MSEREPLSGLDAEIGDEKSRSRFAAWQRAPALTTTARA
jgi:hypothetical protein